MDPSNLANSAMRFCPVMPGSALRRRRPGGKAWVAHSTMAQLDCVFPHRLTSSGCLLALLKSTFTVSTQPRLRRQYYRSSARIRLLLHGTSRYTMRPRLRYRRSCSRVAWLMAFERPATASNTTSPWRSVPHTRRNCSARYAMLMAEALGGPAFLFAPGCFRSRPSQWNIRAAALRRVARYWRADRSGSCTCALFAPLAKGRAICAAGIVSRHLQRH